MRVGGVPVHEIAFYPEYEAPATVVGRNDSRLSAQLSAIVTRVHVDVGDVAQRGAVLVNLDKREFELSRMQAAANLKALKARLEQANIRFNRTRSLFERKAASQQTFDDDQSGVLVLEAQVAAAEVALARAELDLERCVVKAPFRGVVTARDVQLGQLTQPGSPLMTFTELDGAEVSARVSSELAARIEAVKNLRFSWLGGESDVQVSKVLPVIDARSRTRELRLTFKGESALSGASGRLVWKSPRRAAPAHLLVQRDGVLGVFLAQDGKAVFHAIAGAEEGRPAMIDLPDDTLIITEGRLALAHESAIVVQ